MNDESSMMVSAFDAMTGKIADLELQLQVFQEHKDVASSSNTEQPRTKHASPSHGGLLPKVSCLMGAWYGGDTKKVGKLMDQYYNSSAVLQGLVAKKL